MIKELGFPHSLTPVYEDNRPAIAIIYRKDVSQRVRHMRIRDLGGCRLLLGGGPKPGHLPTPGSNKKGRRGGGPPPPEGTPKAPGGLDPPPPSK